MSNTPTLMQSEERDAPWNQSDKEITIDVMVSVSLSKSMPLKVTIPSNIQGDDINEYIKDYVNLEEERDILKETSQFTSDWMVDELVVQQE